MIEDLLIKARQGDKDSMEEILKRLKPLILVSIKRYYNRPDQYEDLIQDGNLRVLEAIGDYDFNKGIHFLGYIKTVLRYMYLDKHKERLQSSLNEKLGDGEKELVDLLLSNDRDILDAMVDRESYQALYRAISRLTERQRQVVILYYMEGLTMEAIGKRLGISYRTVVNLKATALENLKYRGLSR